MQGLLSYWWIIPEIVSQLQRVSTFTGFAIDQCLRHTWAVAVLHGACSHEECAVSLVTIAGHFSVCKPEGRGGRSLWGRARGGGCVCSEAYEHACVCARARVLAGCDCCPSSAAPTPPSWQSATRSGLCRLKRSQGRQVPRIAQAKPHRRLHPSGAEVRCSAAATTLPCLFCIIGRSSLVVVHLHCWLSYSFRHDSSKHGHLTIDASVVPVACLCFWLQL